MKFKCIQSTASMSIQPGDVFSANLVADRGHSLAYNLQCENGDVVARVVKIKETGEIFRACWHEVKFVEVE